MDRGNQISTDGCAKWLLVVVIAWAVTCALAWLVVTA